jgi:hypothetical protein
MTDTARFNRSLRRVLFATFTIAGLFIATATAVEIPTEKYAVLHVDSHQTSQPQDGSQESPFSSINQAVKRATELMDQDQVHARILIQPGSGYRETIDVGTASPRARDLTLTFEGDPAGEAPILYGSVAWPGNEFSKANPNRAHAVYYHSWDGPLFELESDLWESYDFRLANILRRREHLRVGDFPMKLVSQYGELTPGTFYVNDQLGRAGYGNVFVCPPVGVSMSAATTIETAKLKAILKIHHRQHVVVQHLQFLGAADYFEGALQLDYCRDIKIDRCTFAYNCSYGANVSHGEDIELIQNEFYKNGIEGLGGAYVKNLRVQGGSACFNNWRGHHANMEEWDSAGIKFFQIHDSRFEDILISDNVGRAMGLWLDTDVERCRVSNLQATRNHFGFFYEASTGPCLIEKSELSNNSIGLYSSAADHLTVQQCTIANNHGEGQVVLFGHTSDGGRNFVNFETQKRSRVFGNHFRFVQNQIYWDKDRDFKALVSARGIDIEGYRRFQRSYTGQANRYWHPSESKVFLSGEDESFIDFDAWKARLSPGENAESLWQSSP